MIEWLVAQGYTVDTGSHVGLSGYYARIATYGCDTGNECQECGMSIILWSDVAHGHTLNEALGNARSLLKGEPHTVYEPEDFRSKDESN